MTRPSDPVNIRAERVPGRDRVEQLEDALRDILDIASGWTSPNSVRDWVLVSTIAREALDG